MYLNFDLYNAISVIGVKQSLWFFKKLFKTFVKLTGTLAESTRPVGKAGETLSLRKLIFKLFYLFDFRTAHVLTVDCKYNEANKCIMNTSILLSYMNNADLQPNCSLFYTTCSMYMFSLSQYDKVSGAFS